MYRYRYRWTWLDALGSVQIADFGGDEMERIPTNSSTDTNPLLPRIFPFALTGGCEWRSGIHPDMKRFRGIRGATGIPRLHSQLPSSLDDGRDRFPGFHRHDAVRHGSKQCIFGGGPRWAHGAEIIAHETIRVRRADDKTKSPSKQYERRRPENKQPTLAADTLQSGNELARVAEGCDDAPRAIRFCDREHGDFFLGDVVQAEV